MKKCLLLTIIPTIFLLVGCAPQPLYDFGNYSQTLYTLEKEKSEGALVAHKQELERIITQSENSNSPVPPGIYAELGYINLESKNAEEAIRLFKAEAQLYPESQYLMNKLIKSAK